MASSPAGPSGVVATEPTPERRRHHDEEIFATFLEACGCAGGGDHPRHDAANGVSDSSHHPPRLPRASLASFLRRQGLLAEDDERIAGALGRLLGGAESKSNDDDDDLVADDLHRLGSGDAPMSGVIWRAVRGRLIVPKFEEFSATVREIYEKCLKDTSGKNADYIPQLARVNPDQFGVGVCTIDGQRYAVGDVDVPFTIQSCSKIVTYAIAQTLHGAEKVHEHVGVEPSGRPFNQMVLDERAKRDDLAKRRELLRRGRVDEAAAVEVRPALPHNCCINAGAIMCASLVLPGASVDEKFDLVTGTWAKLCGSTPRSKSLRPPTFATSTYLSERSTGDRNVCLSYMMKEEGAFLPGTDIAEALDSYFMYCSIEMTVQTLSVVAATFANGGTCPVTGARVFTHDVVRNCLSVMQSAGMYDYSGTFAFRMGFPAKSGVGGALLVVIPGVCGFATWSPRLDEVGNSARGVRFCRMLSEKFAFHMFAPLVRRAGGEGEEEDEEHTSLAAEFPPEHDGGQYAAELSPSAKVRRQRSKSDSKVSVVNAAKVSPSKPLATTKKIVYTPAEEAIDLLWAAKDGNVDAVRHLLARSVNVDAFDYDLRTALHVAVCENHPNVVRYLLRLGADPLAVDELGGTPLSDAKKSHAENHQAGEDIVSMLEEAVSSAGETIVMPCDLSGASQTVQTAYLSLLAMLPASAEGITTAFLLDVLGRSGILGDDDRLGSVLNALPPGLELIPPSYLEKALSCPIVLRALQGNLAIPDWKYFVEKCSECFTKALSVTEGEVASYIPILAKADPNKFGVSVCSVDGQRASFGDCEDDFGVQSSMKPLNYAIALETMSFRKVYQHCGVEPSGRPFNEMVLDRRRVDGDSHNHNDFPGCEAHDHDHDEDDFKARFDDHGREITATAVPHNPCINAGAIMCSAIIGEGFGVGDKLNIVQRYWERLTGGRKEFCVNEEMYVSESEHADRNRCLAYMMKEAGAFPECSDLERELEFYFKCCSQMQNAKSMAIVAGTLANGGCCPITNERVFSPLTVQSVLSVMFTCGMYDFSGQWSFSMGFPAKSGVGGSILMIVPNVMGLCTWSPRLDGNGNSCRGIAFAKHLEDIFELHVFDKATETLIDSSATKQDLHFRRDEEVRDLVAELSIAAAMGDLGTVMRFAGRFGIELLNLADYDQRTALHLACSAGHAAIVKYLVGRPGIHLAPVDRWGRTPLDDAEKSGSSEIIRTMKGALR